jgi:hypothetical protein
LISKKKEEIEKLSKVALRQTDKIEASLKSLMTFPERISILNDLSDDVKKYKDEINFVELYTAVKNISLKDIDYCPACDTPISQVTNNPFDKADKQLKVLELISAKQKSLQQHTKTLSDSLIKLCRG